jgi:hypothetical protein
MRLLRLVRLTSFVDSRTGQRRELRDPDGLATQRQLWRLNALGMIAVVLPGDAKPLTVGEAAWAIDVAPERGAP